MLMVPCLFIAGVAFGYFVALPRAVDFLLNFNDEHFDILFRAKDYYQFAIDPDRADRSALPGPGRRPGAHAPGDRLGGQLREEPRLRDPARGGRRGRHPDAGSGHDAHRDGPLLVLFELSVLLARIFERRRRAAEPTRSAGPDDDLSLSQTDALRPPRPRTAPHGTSDLPALALLMGGGLVLFGIGGGTNGGLFDAIGGNGGSSTSNDNVFKKRLETYERAAQGQPAGRRRAHRLTKLHFRQREHRRELQPDPGRLHGEGPRRAAPGLRGLAALPGDQPAKPDPTRPTSWSRPTGPPG